jgi:hypothetical protein
MHAHASRYTDIFYPLFLANGVTGIRDAGSYTLLDTLKQWRREILKGKRVGPPRQILSGPPINASSGCTRQSNNEPPGDASIYYTCVSADSADARKLVDSLRVAGVDMLKTYFMDQATYFALAAAARRAKVPFGGHVKSMNAIEASDSGAGILDHVNSGGGLDTLCLGNTASVSSDTATIARCQPVAERFQRNGTWWTPTLVFYGGWSGKYAKSIFKRSKQYLSTFVVDSLHSGNWLRDTVKGAAFSTPRADSLVGLLGILRIAQRVGLPILAATDVVGGGAAAATLPPGFSLHVELAMSVAEGLTPLTALQTATLNPAKLFHATDSMGTVAPGKLADLVLLDANPLADITNTTAIRAVVANGRYFDRAALDKLLAALSSEIQSNTGD